MKYKIKKTYATENPHLAGSIGVRKSLLTIAVASAVSSMSLNAHALSYEFGEVLVDWDNTLTYSAAWRAESPDKDAGTNTGNLNFDKDAMITNRASILSEVSVQYRDYGAFIRGSAFYDDAYFGETDNDALGNPGFSDKTQDAHAKDARLLDAFVYGNFDVLDRNLNVRVGRQVVSWGESLFISGISSSMSPADGTKSNIPGVEVKDILLPVGQVFAQIDLTDNLALAAYSQWEWSKTELNEAGSYFSTNDLLDEAGKDLSPLRRKQDNDPGDSGQWGVALNYYAENVGSGTEFGVYYLNYHDKAPALVMTDFVFNPRADSVVPTAYYLDYLENVKLIGASAGTLIGETNVGAEVAYRKGAVALNTNNLDERDDTIQAQVSFTHSFGVTPFSDDFILSGEAGYNRLVGAKVKPGEESEGAGVAALMTLSYNSVLPGVDMEVPISFRHNIKGHSKAGNFTSTGNNSDRASVGAKFIYQGGLEFAFNYSAFFGDYEDNAITDRDYVSFNAKYSF
ncbi:DUF1302 domain-containing protein [Endozoicomonas numazuensis]|uniref:DUF1302 domain-containing protein n=1 Tax=Endozoicomonas numazuensis TaxID=1137799 RepID=UPI0006911DA9|nr:DUF1302 domain-containing protein [Endozoicomonas numazuensis]